MAPGMDTSKIGELYEHTQKAYDAELVQDWGAAYNFHEAARQQWSNFASTAKFFSKADKVTKCVALRRAELHEQRLNTLRPYTRGGKPLPEVLVMHPSKILTMMGFTERVNLNQLAKATLMDEFKEPLLTAVSGPEWCKFCYDTYREQQEIKTPGQHIPDLPQYATSLPDLPAIKYRTEFSSKLKLGLEFEMVTVTISDVDTGTVLLILEARTLSSGYPPYVNEGFVFRAADYPNPAFTLIPVVSKPTSILAEAITIATLIHGIPGMDHPILETPDRLKKRWGPCRFTYGGRLFVRKPLQEGKPQSGDSVHEYTTTSPKAGSKTGKLEDDSSKTSLFNIKYSIRSTQYASGAVDLDPLFKEYLFAVQLMKAITDRHGALPPKQSLAETAGVGNVAAAGAAVGIVGAIIEVVAALAGA